jgi:parallel beta-helix repeat protein
MSLSMNRIPRLCYAIAVLLSTASLIAFPSNGNLYTPPTSQAFIENAGETVITVNDNSGSIATAQTALNNAHTNNPGAVVVLTLSGTYTVTTTPLNLTSHTCLVLQAHAVIKAGSGATAAALIQVSGQSNVSIAGGTLDGSGLALNAIKVITSNRVNIDQVLVQNCGADGISVAGNGNSTFDNENTVTRCEVFGCSGDGISITSGTQNIVIDNNCHNNTAAGINISTARSTAANNRCANNGTGFLVGGSYNKISDNTVDANATGISLASGGSRNEAVSNNITNNTTVGLSEAGANSLLFQNVFSGNASDVSASGTSGNFVAWQKPMSISGQNYFYPPLIDNPHTQTTIVNGLGRFDLTIGSTSLDSVQTQYNSAVSAHPTSVIVLHLTGTYSVGANSLNLGSNTVVLLSGKIAESSSSTTASAITITSGAQNVAISGGTVDCGGRSATNAINLSGGNCVWVHATIAQNAGVPSTRGSDSNALIKFSSMQGPAFVSSSTVNESGERGIWTEGFGPYVITDNTCTNNNEDGIDCDYTTQEALAKFNNSSSNVRDGIFIEQGATYNVAYGNTFNNDNHGLPLFNNAEPSSKPVSYNTTFCNTMTGGSSGLGNGSIGTGSDGTTSLCSHNFYFGNSASNSQVGIQSKVTGTQNYYSQTMLSNNVTEISTTGSEAFFNPTTPPVVVADPTFSLGGGTYSSAQLVSITTATGGASIRYTTDGSTPSETVGTLYSGAITVSSNTTVKAIAYETGMSDSNVVSVTYSIQAAAPTFSPGAGTYSSAQSVTISSTTGGVSIRYTTDGSTPTETNGTLYSGPVTVSGSETLKAIAYSSSNADSNVSSAVYTITQPQVAAPTFIPAGGSYSSAQTVTISSTTNGASIRYTIDGSTPTETNGTLYSGPISISVTTTLKAIAYEAGFSDSTVSTAIYTISNGTTLTSASGFYNQAMPAAQAGTFTTSWDASTSISPSNSLIGLSQGSATAYTGIAVSVRFNPSGDIDARNGGAYAALSTIPYSANMTYHFRVVVNVPAHTYSAYVTPPGGSEITIGTNYAFRTEQAGVTQLDTWNADVNATPGGSLTVSNFSTTSYTITASAGSNGSISPTGAVTVGQGANQAFTITPNSGYAISAVTVDGTSVGAVSSYTFTNVQANHTISATFAALPTFTITASAGSNGTISPTGPVTVNQGANQAFTITPNSGYVVSTVTVDGTSVGAVTSYTFSNVQANHTISASFTASVSDTNIAPSGTGYGWSANTSSTANTNKAAHTGLNDNNLTADVDLDSAGDAIGAWEAAGVTWSTAKTISSAKFINGTVTSGGDGFLTANLKLQFSTDGSTWTDSGWTVSPAYPYSSSASGQTYTFSGTAKTGVLGARVVGQVRTTDTSYHWIVKEVQFIGH